MYFIESERLKLIPLNYEQLLQLQNNRQVLEQSLGLNPSAMVVDAFYEGEIKQAMHNFWLPCTRTFPDLYYWCTNWEVVLKSANTVIGGISFGGYPDDYGETSVGYMIDEQHWGHGYATEALQTLNLWGFGFSILKAIKADTQVSNKASQSVLLKGGFKETHANDGLLYYKLAKASFKNRLR